MNKIGFNVPVIKPFKKADAVNQNQNNPFAVSFKGQLSADVFELSQSQPLKEEGFLAKNFAEFAANCNQSFTGTKEGFAKTFQPAVSFASSLKTKAVDFWAKLNNTTVSDVVAFAKEEFAMFGVDKEVRGFMKKPVSELRTMLSEALAV